MILISRCCTGPHCRYNHKGFFRKFIEKVAESENFISLCPEQMGGLPTPREGCSVNKNGQVVGRRTGTDFTPEYTKGAEATLKLCKQLRITKAYLLKNSPSCGAGYGLTAKLLEKNNIEVIPV